MGVRINGKEVNPGERRLLPLLLSLGIYIPHLCYNQGLVPLKTCDVCVVEVNGQLRRACDMEIAPGDTIDTESERVLRVRKKAMNRILRNHKLYCTLCDNNVDCELHEAVLREDIRRQNYDPKPYEVDQSNPFYVYDPSQCILCGRCVEACQDFAVNEVIWIDWGLKPPRVVWDRGAKAGESSCVSCGTCVTVCPVNALIEKSMLGKAGFFTGMNGKVREEIIQALGKSEEDFYPLTLLSHVESIARRSMIKRTKTVCIYCGVGCSFEVWTKGREVLKVEPRPESPANGILTCVKGKFGWDFVNSPNRLTKPVIREGKEFRRASWEEALKLVAKRIKEIKDRYGPDSIGFIASDKCSNEEAYLVQKLARQVIGTNNVDNSARYCQAPATVGLWRTVGIGADSGTIRDIEMADLILIVGHNTTESHPVIGSKVKRAKKIKGTKIVVIDVRRSEIADWADLFLSPRPGTDVVVLSAVAKYILDMGWEDEDFLARRVKGVEEFRESLKGLTLDYAEKVSGVSAEKIRRLAEIIHHSKRIVALWGMGVTQHLGGADTSTTISNLLLLTGNYGRPGTGAYPMRGHNNVQGASDFGTLPTYLPGYQPLGDEEVRRKFERSWGCTLPSAPGKTVPEMIEGVLRGEIHALYIIGEDTVMVDCGTPLTRKALEEVEFLVVQDVFLTETAKYAHVVLPASTSLEKEGTFVNTERRIQRFYRAMEPLGESRPDWEILMALAKELGTQWNYRNPADVMAEASSLCPIFAGVSYERLEGFKSLCWPVDQRGSDTPLLYVEEFSLPGGKAKLYPVKWWEGRVKEVGVVINSGRILEHFHVGNMTGHVKGLTEMVPQPFVEVSREIAAEYSIKDGDIVEVRSKEGGEIRAKAVVSERVKGNEIFVPLFAGGGQSVNEVTGRQVDQESGTPGYKDSIVKLSKVKRGEGSPLPVSNWRFHVKDRKRQMGIGVEERWKREEFKPLVE
jgi:formate dehydrogenase major subunit